jgi:hypothetical protein
MTSSGSELTKYPSVQSENCTIFIESEFDPGVRRSAHVSKQYCNMDGAGL